MKVKTATEYLIKFVVPVGASDEARAYVEDYTAKGIDPFLTELRTRFHDAGVRTFVRSDDVYQEVQATCDGA